MSDQMKTGRNRATFQRRNMFLGLFVVMIAGLLIPFQPKIVVTRAAQDTFDFIETLPAGSTVMVSFDHEASSYPEMRPLAEALIGHLFSRDIKIVGLSLFTEGTGIGATLLDQIAKDNQKEYGVDFAFLGFKPPPVATIIGMGVSISQIYPRDYYDTPITELPLMQSTLNYDSLAAVITIADGSTPVHWAEYGAARYDIDIVTVTAATMVTQFDPYVRSGQMRSLIGGLRGAAEYETLMNNVGGGSRGMLAQSAAHVYLTLVIIFGNIIYWRNNRGA